MSCILQNWSLKDYNNKLCVLDGKLVEHCEFAPQTVDVNVLPCQSFPIEAVQYTGMSVSASHQSLM